MAVATTLVYLEDFDIVACEAAVVDLAHTEDGRTVVILDQTCFYPRGGGQDWDTGNIQDSEDNSFMVQEVRLDEQGAAHHIGQFTKGEFSIGRKVKCEVNQAVRQVNTRLHSAGHLIDMAVSALRPDWVPVRGAHYPHMSFVEYSVPEGEQIDGTFAEAVQAAVAKLSQSTYENQLRFMARDEMSKYCRHVPKNLPVNKPSRIVLYADDFGIPCGGTHVKKASEVGEVTISKIKIKKSLAKVSYAVTGIN